MKLKGTIILSLGVVLFLLSAYSPISSSVDKEKTIMQVMVGGLTQAHYDPQKLNDDFSEKVYDLYLERIDSRKRWFTIQDVEKLDVFKYKIDDYTYSADYAVMEAAIELKSAGVEKAARFYNDILSKPFAFTDFERVEYDSDKKEWAKDDKELFDYWRKDLKYRVLTRVLNKKDAQDEKEDVEKKSIEALEEISRNEVKEDMDEFFERINKSKRTDHLSTYLNAIANVFDPHSGYYEPYDKENFDMQMSGTLEGIGARLQTEGDLTKVSSIVPGGPAWKQKGLSANDLILKVSQKDAEPVDISGMRIDDVVKMIRGKKGTIVILTVKKVDGSVVDIPIQRDVVILEEGFAKSLLVDHSILDGTVGYINLPRFYADFNRNGGSNCYTDVKNEIEKLKDKNVEGIILDLRSNGGGSLKDVVRMSGLFIEEGPIVQVKSRGNEPEVLKDKDMKVQYKGPLIVMVNNFSASASEILAAALQDYGRAVIVGSNSTFGKGTVQRFFDLDRFVKGKSDIKPLGEIKMTIQKFYRVNGGSTQLKGVTPDIILPDNYHFIQTGEKENEFAMDWTEIKPMDYQQNVFRIKNLSEIQAKSKARVNSNSTFIRIKENAERLKAQRDKSDYALHIETFRAEEKKQEKEAERFKDLFDKDISGLKVVNLPEDMDHINADSSRIARNGDWLEGINKDVYLEEALHVMKDLIGK